MPSSSRSHSSALFPSCCQSQIPYRNPHTLLDPTRSILSLTGRAPFTPFTGLPGLRSSSLWNNFKQWYRFLIYPSCLLVSARRLHRLPQRLDYNLIPAPLGKIRRIIEWEHIIDDASDLSLPQATEKSPLPAIIVTPSSPSLDAPEYYIAFLTPPPKPSLRERITQLPSFQGQFPFKTRTTLFISLLLLILVCHLLAHLAAHRPHFDFKSSDIAAHSDSHAASPWNFLSFDFQPFWDTAANGDRRNYIVEELSQAAHR